MTVATSLPLLTVLCKSFEYAPITENRDVVSLLYMLLLCYNCRTAYRNTEVLGLMKNHANMILTNVGKS